jgi:hypothetical protein
MQPAMAPPTPPAVDAAKKKRVLLFLIIATIAGGLLGLMSLAAVLASFFVFDAPGSEKNPYLLTMVWGIWLFPVTCAVAIAAGWIVYAMKQLKLARLVFLLPAVDFVVFLVGFTLVSTVCHGDFVCK